MLNLWKIWPFYPGSSSWYILYSALQSILIFILCCGALYLGLTWVDLLIKIAVVAIRHLDGILNSLFLFVSL